MILQQLSIARLIRVLLLSLLLLFGLLISYSNGLPVESKQKQRRRLRRHKQEIFKLPEKVGTRRKGSHKSSRQRNNRHPSYVAEFEEYYGTSGTHFDRTDHPTALPTSEDTYFPTNENDLSRKASKSKKKGKSHYSGGKASTKGKKSSAYKSCPKRKKKRAGKSLFWGLYNETSNDTDLYEYDCPQRKSKKRGKSYGKSLSSYGKLLIA